MLGAVMHVQVPSLYTVYFKLHRKSKRLHKATVGQIILDSGIYVSRDNASKRCDHFEIFQFHLWTGKWIKKLKLHNPDTRISNFDWHLSSCVFQIAQCTSIDEIYRTIFCIERHIKFFWSILCDLDICIKAFAMRHCNRC